jgi:hypothetical protein
VLISFSLTRVNALKKSSKENSDAQTYVYEVPAAILLLSFHIRQNVQIRLKGVYTRVRALSLSLLFFSLDGEW